MPSGGCDRPAHPKTMATWQMLFSVGAARVNPRPCPVTRAHAESHNTAPEKGS